MRDSSILPRRPGFRDLALEHFAADEADLLAYIRELEADTRAYRELCSAVLTRLHTLLHANEGLRRALLALDADRRRTA
jgi:hypothetical protein